MFQVKIVSRHTCGSRGRVGAQGGKPRIEDIDKHKYSNGSLVTGRRRIRGEREEEKKPNLGRNEEEGGQSSQFGAGGRGKTCRSKKVVPVNTTCDKKGAFAKEPRNGHEIRTGGQGVIFKLRQMTRGWGGNVECADRVVKNHERSNGRRQ